MDKEDLTEAEKEEFTKSKPDNPDSGVSTGTCSPTDSNEGATRTTDNTTDAIFILQEQVRLWIMRNKNWPVYVDCWVYNLSMEYTVLEFVTCINFIFHNKLRNALKFNVYLDTELDVSDRNKVKYRANITKTRF